MASFFLLQLDRPKLVALRSLPCGMAEEQPARDAALLQDSRGPDTHEPWGPFCRKEFKAMWSLGWPIAVSMFCRFAMFSMDSACVGHLNNKPLIDKMQPLLNFPWSMSSTEMPNLPAAPLTLVELEDVYGPAEDATTLSDQIYTPKEYLAASSLSDTCQCFLVQKAVE